ncbi:MAG: hypothetical protein ABI591_33050 [Kofleriaceae bacterium]
MGLGTVIVIGIALGSLAVAVRFFTSDLRAKKALRRVAHVKIADVRDGVRVKLIGTVGRVVAPLTSPNRGEPCVYYHAWYEELQRGSKGGVGWVGVGDEQHACDFTLEDETGVAIIEGEGLDGALDPTTYVQIKAANPNERGREAVVGVGQRVAIIGRATLEAASGTESSLYRDGGPRVVIRVDRDITPIVTNDPTLT